MRTHESDIKTGGGAQSRALAIVAPSARIRLVQANPETALRYGPWGLQYRCGRQVQRAPLTAVNDRFGFPGRLTIALGEVVEILIATSGTLLVVMILLSMAMLMRGIRTLLRR